MSTPRPHEPAGTYVSVIRHEHGWHDGSISGVLVDDHGTVRIDGDEGLLLPPDQQYTVECRHRRDYEPTDQRPQAPHQSKRERRGAKRMEQKERQHQLHAKVKP